jgi:hypothetical protein
MADPINQAQQQLSGLPAMMAFNALRSAFRGAGPFLVMAAAGTAAAAVYGAVKAGKAIEKQITKIRPGNNKAGKLYRELEKKGFKDKEGKQIPLGDLMSYYEIKGDTYKKFEKYAKKFDMPFAAVKMGKDVEGKDRYEVMVAKDHEKTLAKIKDHVYNEMANEKQARESNANNSNPDNNSPYIGTSPTLEVFVDNEGSTFLAQDGEIVVEYRSADIPQEDIATLKQGGSRPFENGWLGGGSMAMVPEGHGGCHKKWYQALSNCEATKRYTLHEYIEHHDIKITPPETNTLDDLEGNFKGIPAEKSFFQKVFDKITEEIKKICASLGFNLWEEPPKKLEMSAEEIEQNINEDFASEKSDKIAQEATQEITALTEPEAPAAPKEQNKFHKLSAKDNETLQKAMTNLRHYLGLGKGDLQQKDKEALDTLLKNMGFRGKVSFGGVKGDWVVVFETSKKTASMAALEKLAKLDPKEKPGFFKQVRNKKGLGQKVELITKEANKKPKAAKEKNKEPALTGPSA